MPWSGTSSRITKNLQPLIPTRYPAALARGAVGLRGRFARSLRVALQGCVELELTKSEAAAFTSPMNPG